MLSMLSSLGARTVKVHNTYRKQLWTFYLQSSEPCLFLHPQNRRRFGGKFGWKFPERHW
jgi:hypothetical protein